MPRPKLKVFWDLATCPISDSYQSLLEVLQDIRQFTSNFGIVTSIKAYYDKNNIRSANDPILAVMPSMGVNLVDCSSMQGYTADALSKMLSVDIVISAMDNPTGPEGPEDDIIMIISGDKSVLYPISLLMFRGFIVFLAVPDDVQDVQPFQATQVFSWYREVLGFESNLKPIHSVATGSLKSPEWAVNGPHLPQLRSDRTTVATPSSIFSPRLTTLMHKLPSRSTTTTYHSSPAIAPSAKDAILPPAEIQSPRAPLSLGSNSHVLAVNPPINFGTASAGPSFPGRKSVASEISGTQPEIKPPENRNNSLVNFGTVPAGPSFMGGTSVASETSGTQPETKPPENHNNASVLAAEGWVTSGDGWNAGGGWEMTGSSWLSEPAPAPMPEVNLKITSGKMDPKQQETTEPQTQQVNGQPVAPAKEALPLFIFDPLVKILREAENESMRRSQLGQHLAAHKGLFQSAGVNKFSDFINLAVNQNLVMLSGTGHVQQVKLKKRESWE